LRACLAIPNLYGRNLEPHKRMANRRLAAILAADIVGYSAAMSADDERTLRQLKFAQSAVLPILEEHGGRIIDLAGDGILAEFGSAVRAVESAIKMQSRMQRINDETGASLLFRIGIDIGDVLYDNERLFGDGVNIASRLESLAPPGGICVSSKVYDELRDRVECNFVDLGRQSLKNIPFQVHAFELRAKEMVEGRENRSGASTTLPLPSKPSIAVLPFANLSGDPEQEYFADGVVEDIITALSRVPSFFVIARNSSFTYKGRTVDVRQVGRELGVRYLLEGGIRKAGNRVRLTGQLIDATTGTHIWANHFEGSLEDVFDLQDRITASVAGAIEPKLQQAEIQRARTKPTESLTAYDLYLRALGLFHEYSEASLRHALSLLDQVITADPQYASAYGLAAWCCRLLINYGRSDDDDVRAHGVRMAYLAVAKGRDDPLALALGGAQIALLGGAYEEGLAHIERALALNPNSARAWELCGWVSFSLGQHEKSIACFEKAMRLSPLDPLAALPYAGIAWPFFFTGRYDESIAWADKACREMPNSALPLRPKIAAATLAGRMAEAEDAIRRLRAINPDVSIARLMRIDISRPRAQRDRVEEALRKAGLPE
jgi:TolB-like protein/class 3 adenylate cyclase